MTGLFKDWREHWSWGRFCAAVALVVAIVGQFTGKMDAGQLALWLGVALGSYGASKAAEVLTVRGYQ